MSIQRVSGTIIHQTVQRSDGARLMGHSKRTQTLQNVSDNHTRRSIDTLAAPAGVCHRLTECAIECWSLCFEQICEYEILCCMRSHAIQDPALYKIPCCTRSCAA